MQLKDIRKSKGYNKGSRRLGRGDASGKGNYSGRGLLGQHSRSGGGMPAWFEGGQTTSVKRVPKLRGFKRSEKFRKIYTPINLESIEKDANIEDGSKVDKKMLKELNYIKSENESVKILGDGELTKKIEFVDVESFSSSAKEKIEKLQK